MSPETNTKKSGKKRNKEELVLYITQIIIEFFIREKFKNQKLDDIVERIKKIQSQESLEKIPKLLQESATVDEFKTRLIKAQILK